MKNINFKQWVESHDPELNWDFDNPKNLVEQLSNVIGESGHIDLKTIFLVLFSMQDVDLTHEQKDRFINTNY